MSCSYFDWSCSVPFISFTGSTISRSTQQRKGYGLHNIVSLDHLWELCRYPVWGCTCSGCMEWLEHDSFWLLWGLGPPQFHPERMCYLFLLHLPRKSSKKNPHIFLDFSNLTFPQKFQCQCFTKDSGVHDFLSLHPAFQRTFSLCDQALSAAANTWCPVPHH